MSREPKTHIGESTSKKRPTWNRMLILLGHRFPRRQQIYSKKTPNRDSNVRHYQRLYSACRIDRQHERLPRARWGGPPRAHRRVFQVAKSASSEWSLAIFPRDRRWTQHGLLGTGR